MKYVILPSVLITVLFFISCGSGRTEKAQNSETVNAVEEPAADTEERKPSFSDPDADSYGYDELLKKGKALYKSKENEKARFYLEKAAAMKHGEADYYLGNVLMNMKDYLPAVVHYNFAYEADYSKHNSLFNKACALSLSKQFSECYLALLLNYTEGDRKLERIDKDADLADFRESRFYNRFKAAVEKISPGITPRTGDDILKYISSVGSAMPPDAPSPGLIRFYTDGTFMLIEAGGGVPENPAGTWSIDETARQFRIKCFVRVLGRQGNCEEYLSEENNLCIVDKSDPVEDVISFDDIRLNIVKVSFLEDDKGIWMQYNNFNLSGKNRVLKDIYGDRIDF